MTVNDSGVAAYCWEYMYGVCDFYGASWAGGLRLSWNYTTVIYKEEASCSASIYESTTSMAVNGYMYTRGSMHSDSNAFMACYTICRSTV